MADETLTSAAPASPAPATESVAQAPATSEPAAPQSADAQTPTTPEKKVNLFELEDFRKYQAAQERRIAQERAEYQRQQQQLAAQLRELQTKDLSAEERTAYERDELKRQLAQVQEQQQYQQLAAQRWQDIQQLAQVSGAPPEALDKASNIVEATMMAMQYMRQGYESRVQTEAEALAEKRRANKVDLGGGGVTTSVDAIEQKFKEAAKSGDALTYMRLLREQQKAARS